MGCGYCKSDAQQNPSLEIVHNVKNNKQNQLVKLINANYTLYEIQEEIPNARYFIYKNQICNLDNFIHPGICNSINMDFLLGREIDRYFYGGYNLEQLAEIQKQYHSINSSQKWFADRKIGELDQTKFKLMEFKDQYIAQIENQTFKIVSHQYVTTSSALFYFSLEGLKVKNIQNGVDWFGRQMRLRSTQNSRTRLYTIVNCMTKQNMKFMQHLLYENCQENECTVTLDPYSKEFPLLIKKHDTENAFSSFIHSYNMRDQFVLEGPQGLGLQLNKNSKGKFIGIAGGLGIVPFLDLMDFLIKKIIFLTVKKSQSEQFARQHIEKGYGLEESLNNFQFILYFAIQSKDEFVGRELVENLYKLNEQFQYNFFKCILRCKEPFECDIPIVSKRFDKAFFENEVKNWEDLQRVYLVGPYQMKIDIYNTLKELGIDEKQLTYF